MGQAPGSHLCAARLQKEAGVFLQDFQLRQGQHAAEADGQKPEISSPRPGAASSYRVEGKAERAGPGGAAGQNGGESAAPSGSGPSWEPVPPVCPEARVHTCASRSFAPRAVLTSGQDL